MADETVTEQPKKISKHQFYFETALYDVTKTEKLVEDLFAGDVDAYNPASGYDTTYTIETSHIGYHDNDYRGFFTVTLTCKRNGQDMLRFFIFKDKEVAVKLGQFPSLADIQFAEIGKKYDRFLTREDLQEFKKAIGLAAHGVGAGSFVYLRRIFENLIKETFEKNKVALGISEQDFSKKRMAEKVEFLRDFLPSQLVEMKSIYGILSNGVHELSEQECLKYFPVLKLSIELILEQRIEMETKTARDEAVKKQIAEIGQQFKQEKTV
jgi:hypothetical protein